MKTADQILDNVMCCTIEEDAEDVKENYYYRHNDVVKAIEQAQKEAYNQALEDAVENAKVDTYELDPIGDNGFILQKTLRLPLYTRGFNLIIVGKVELNKDSILKLKK